MKKDNSLRANNFADNTKFSNKKFTSQIINSKLRAAAVETLEERRLMSSSVSLSNGVLSIVGNTSGSNNISATLVNNGKSIYANAGSGHTLTVALSSVQKIVVDGGSGNDTLTVDSNIHLPATISGGAGNDVIWGGGGKNDISEGNGNDWINDRGFDSYVQAGNGNDTVYSSYIGDTIVAGNGNDWIAGQSGGNDSIVAGNGRDTINGGGGTNTLSVGTGASTVNLGKGANVVALGSSNTHVTGATSADKITTAGSSAASGTTTTISPATATTSSTGTGSTSTGSSSSSNLTPSSTENLGTTNWSSYSAATVSIGGVQAIMQVLAPAPTVGIAVVVRALNSKLGAGTPINSNYQWNFGDPSSAFNTLPGFNAAHIYNTPGVYQITLTVTNYLHQSSVVKMNIKISADTRKVIYVNSVSGNDSNNGLSPSTAVKTAARADQMVGNNTEVLFDRGETFNLSAAFKLNYQNVLVGAYGSGALPIINYTSLIEGSVIFTTNSKSAEGVTIEDVFLTTLMGVGPYTAAPPMGVMAGGYDTSVVGCTFGVVEYGVNASAAPLGLTVIDNSSPTLNDIQGYFVWDQGTDTTLLGNYVNGSAHEHIFRTSGATEMLIDDNNFSNYDGKGCIEIHVGGYAWIDSNTVNGGDIRVGPLGLWGEPVDATVDSVIQANTVNNTDIQVYPGAQNISIRNNVITRAGQQLIDVIGQDGEGRQSANINILDNTGIDTASTGNFLKVENHTDGITLENNLFIDPSLAVGGYNTAPVYVAENNLSSFSYISGNVWPEPVFYAWARGGINYIGSAYVSSGYQSVTEWNSYSNVGTDTFSSTPLKTGSYTPMADSVAASLDLPVAGVFTDFYGQTRSSSGPWAAGAVI
jgi:hypothetical protein